MLTQNYCNWRETELNSAETKVLEEYLENLLKLLKVVSTTRRLSLVAPSALHITVEWILR